MDQTGIFCKFCFEGMTGRKFQTLGEVTAEILSTLSLIVGLDERDSYMCTDCSVKLFAAYDFKVMCLDTENSLVPYIDFKNAAYIDLRDIYLKVKEGKGLTLSLDHQVCRLCMNITDDGFVSIKEQCDVNVNIYIPEINFSITKDPVVCEECWNSLSIHIDFLRNWVNMNKKIKMEVQDPVDNLFIEREEMDAIRIKNEKNDPMLEDDKRNLVLLPEWTEAIQEQCVVKDEIEDKHASHSNNSEGTSEHQDPLKGHIMYPCDQCEFQTKWKASLWQHQKLHKGLSVSQTYICRKCDYETKSKLNLRQHQAKHEKSSTKVQIYRCDKCDFQSKWRDSFRKHQLLHKDPSEIRMHKCDQCDFQSKRKGDLSIHQLQHKDPSEIRMYKCDKCDFQSKRRYGLLTHELTHKDPSDIQMYKCEECDFQSRWKKSFVLHQLQHKDSSELQMYKCDICNFESKWRHCLLDHQIVHKDPSELQMYKCDKCDYETKRKKHLKQHQVKHKSASEVEMYKCNECDFQCKMKGNLRKHQLTHKDHSELQMYKCEKCNFQSKWKKSVLTHQQRHKDFS